MAENLRLRADKGVRRYTSCEKDIDELEADARIDEILIRGLRAEIERLQEYKRKQMEDIMTLGQQVGKLEQDNAKLRRFIETGRPFWAQGDAELRAEIERLTAALQEIADNRYNEVAGVLSQKARRALEGGS